MNKKDNPQQTESVSQWQILWIKAVAQSWKDPAFKQRLIADPHGTLEKTFGATVPPGVKLKVEHLGTNGPKANALSGKTFAPPSELVKQDGTVVMPLPAPPDDTADHALALASMMEWYQQDGCCGNPCCS